MWEAFELKETLRGYKQVDVKFCFSDIFRGIVEGNNVKPS